MGFGADIAGVINPRLFQVSNIVRVNLVQTGVMATAWRAAIIIPLSGEGIKSETDR